jgi:hypothetical protein
MLFKEIIAVYRVDIMAVEIKVRIATRPYTSGNM